MERGLAGISCRKGYLDTLGQLQSWLDTFDLRLGEFGEVGDSEEELADPVREGEVIVSNLFILDHDQFPTPIITIAAISNFLCRHLTFLLLFPFYNPDAINLHVLMVLHRGGLV